MKTEGKLVIMWTILLILIVIGFYFLSKVEGHEYYVREKEAYREMMVKMTAYSSSTDETDDTPDITAHNTKTREGVLANNCLPFGTEVVIGGKVYVVEDRMNKRYGCEHMDVWMKSKKEALQYGVQKLTVQIIHQNGD